MSSSFKASLKDYKPEFRAVPRACSDDTSRYAVLFPLTGMQVPVVEPYHPKVHKFASMADIITKTKRLVRMWCGQILSLNSSGWSAAATDSDMYNMATCCPTFAISTSPRVYRCCRHNLCPFCYGRVVQNIYNLVAKVSKPSLGADYQLVGFRSTTVLLGNGKNNTSALSRRIDQEVKWRLKQYNSMQGFSGYMNVTIEPSGTDDWKVIRRGVVLASNTPDVLKVLPKDSRSWTLDTYDTGDLVRLVGNVMRYPAGLLNRSNAARLVTLLNVRANRRLSATYGGMRKYPTSR